MKTWHNELYGVSQLYNGTHCSNLRTLLEAFYSPLYFLDVYSSDSIQKAQIGGKLNIKIKY
jgi:hypothetical protein